MKQTNLSTTALLIQSGREITQQDIDIIQCTIKRFPTLSRTDLIGTVCECLEWFNAAGNPKASACQKVLETLEQQGLIRLPAKDLRFSRNSRPKPIVFTDQTREQPPLTGTLSSFAPIDVIPIADTEDKQLWNEYMARYHPLGHKKPMGYAMRYFILSGNQVLGCVLMAGAAKMLAPRDHWIGWDKTSRLRHLAWIINNSRYLLLPWVHIRYLASHVLGQLATRVANDFDAEWGFRPLLMETFVDPAHYSGICYRAAGWTCLGQTTGQGLTRPGKQYTSSPKLIFVKPLHPECRELLRAEHLTTDMTYEQNQPSTRPRRD